MVGSTARSRSIRVLLVLTLAGALPLTAPGRAHAGTIFTVNSTRDTADSNIGNGVCDTQPRAGRQCTLRAAIQEANEVNAAPASGPLARPPWMPGSAAVGGPWVPQGGTQITFDIVSADDIKTISPTRPLPPITQPVLLDGYTQPGASRNTLEIGNDAVLKIQLNGTNAGGSTIGLRVQESSVVRGLIINRYGGAGIELTETDSVVVGNFIGTDAGGTLDLGNGGPGLVLSQDQSSSIGDDPEDRNVISGNDGSGIVISASAGQETILLSNYVGTTKDGNAPLGNAGCGIAITGPGKTGVGAPTGVGNLISGNAGDGICIAGPGSPPHVIASNFIGTDATGTSAIGNGGNGVAISDSARNTIGGGNLISGNGGDGIFIQGATSTANLIVGNRIGTDAPGTQAIGNALSGVAVFGFASGTTIGGTTAASRNVISGNVQSGIVLFARDNRVLGNRIGTRGDGLGDLGNGGHGVVVSDLDNRIGGLGTGAANAIAHSGGDGVHVTGPFTSGVKVLGNVISNSASDGVHLSTGGTANVVQGNTIVSNADDGVAVSSTRGNRITSNIIFANAGLGIDLGGGVEDGFDVTANDAGDPDTGSNRLQNYPVITSAIRSSGSGLTTVVGSLNSTPNERFTIQWFLAEGDPSGHGEGQVFLGETTATTNASGNASLSFTTFTLVVGQRVTATATNVETDDTSEFAENRTVAAG